MIVFRKTVCIILTAIMLLPILNYLVRPQAAEKKLVALTFDDGPCSDTNRLLDELKKRGVHVTFFMQGPNAQRYPAIVKRCYEEGHQIANHTYDHAELTKLSDAQIKKQVGDTAAILDQAIGAKNTYIVRPPYGSYNQRVLNALGVPAIYWSVDSNDWRWTNDADKTCSEIMKYTGDGDIILVHDIHTWSVTGAIKAVDKLLAQGYEFVTVSELFRRRGTTMTAGNIYFSKRPNGTDLPAISAPTVKLSATNSTLSITMTADPGTKIYYTTDGTIPNAASKIYTGPIPLNSGSIQITAVAGYDMNGSRSTVTRATLQYQKLTEPKLTIGADGLVTVNGGGQLRYTTDGNTPGTGAAVYSTPFRVSPGTVVKVRSFSPNGSAIPSGTVALCYSDKRQVYADVTPKDWYYSGVEYAVSEGLLQGVGENCISPTGKVTRAMLVTVLHRVSGTPKPTGSGGFIDVKAGKWYTDAILWAKENRIVEGYADGSFRPDNTVTRQQLAVILYRYHRYFRGMRAEENGDLSSYADRAGIADYARAALSWATGCGIVSGLPENLLAPQGTANRAQLSVLLQRYLTATAGESRYYLTDAELLRQANELLPLLEDKEYTALAELIDEERGLTLTAYSTVNDSDNTLFASALASTKLGGTLQLWGFWDGSGELMELSTDEYWDRFVWNADYNHADEIGVNRIVRAGNAVENLEQAYPECLFVDYYLHSTQGYNDETDWGSLKLVFRNCGGQWRLTAIVHGEWTL